MHVGHPAAAGEAALDHDQAGFSRPGTATAGAGYVPESSGFESRRKA